MKKIFSIESLLVTVRNILEMKESSPQGVLKEVVYVVISSDCKITMLLTRQNRYIQIGSVINGSEHFLFTNADQIMDLKRAFIHDQNFVFCAPKSTWRCCFGHDVFLNVVSFGSRGRFLEVDATPDNVKEIIKYLHLDNELLHPYEVMFAEPVLRKRGWDDAAIERLYAVTCV